MAFDLSTAKPAEQSSGFDLSTARPVEPEQSFGQKVAGFTKDAITMPFQAAAEVVTGAKRTAEPDAPELPNAYKPHSGGQNVGEVAKFLQERNDIEGIKKVTPTFDANGNAMVYIEAEPGSPLDVRGLANKNVYLNKPGLSFNDPGDVVSGALRNAPAIGAGVATGGAGFIPAVTTTGVTGMASETIQQTGEAMQGREFDGMQILKTGAWSALGEGAGRVAASVLSKVISPFLKSKPGIQLIDDTGKISDDAIAMLEKQGIKQSQIADMMELELKKHPDKYLDAQQMRRFNEFKELDPRLNPTRAQVSQTADDFVKQDDLLHNNETGGLVRQQLNTQDEIIKENITGVAEKTGGQTDDLYTAGEKALNFVAKKAQSIDDQVSGLYRDARTGEATDILAVSPARLMKYINENAHLDTPAGGVINSFKGELRKVGAINKDGEIIRKMTGEEAETVRKLYSRLWNDGNKAQQKALLEMRDALDDDVFSGFGRDIFEKGRKLKAQWHKEFNNKGARLIRDIAQGKTTPDKFIQQKVISGTYRDLASIKKTLTTGRDRALVKEGQQAWDDIRRSVILQGLEKSSIGKIADGQTRISGVKFNKFLDSIGDKKLSELFTTNELKILNQIRRVNELRTPIIGTTNPPGSGHKVVNFLRGILGNSPKMAPVRMVGETVKSATKNAKAGVELERMLNPAQSTAKSINALSGAIKRGRRITPRVGNYLGTQQANDQ